MQELAYLIREKDSGKPVTDLTGSELDDLRGYLDSTIKTLATYLAIPPAADVETARRTASGV